MELFSCAAIPDVTHPAHCAPAGRTGGSVQELLGASAYVWVNVVMGLSFCKLISLQGQDQLRQQSLTSLIPLTAHQLAAQEAAFRNF